MSSGAWTPAEEALLLERVQAGATPYSIWREFEANGIKRTQKAIVRKIQNMKKREPRRWRAMVREPWEEYGKYDKEVSIESDAFLTLFDPHCPLHDAAFLNNLIDLALRWGIKDVIVGGDVIDFDALSYYGKQIHTEADAEIEATAQLLRVLAAEFERVVEIAGNHEMRAVRLLNKQLPVSRIMQWWATQENVVLTDYQWCEVTSGGEGYYIEHPGSASVKATAVALALAETHQHHIIAGHGHLWGMIRDKSNTFYCIDAGVTADPERFAYSQQVHRRRPRMVQGACFVRDGVPTLVDPEIVKALLKEQNNGRHDANGLQHWRSARSAQGGGQRRRDVLFRGQAGRGHGEHRRNRGEEHHATLRRCLWTENRDHCWHCRAAGR